MGIFQQALDALPSSLTSDAEKIKALCDQIKQEEKDRISDEYAIHHIENIPDGANVFLSLPITGKLQKENGALTLERELGNIFVVVFYTQKETDYKFKKQKLWEIRETSPEKILTEYAKIYKYLEGK